MHPKFNQRCQRLLSELGIAEIGTQLEVQRLTGGVASDIGLVVLADQKICVKFSLATLRVAEHWCAPVHRNKAEYEWLRFAATCVPEHVPEVYGFSLDEYGFAMEFIDGGDVYLWKKALLNSVPDSGQAGAVAAVLGQVHAASATADFDRTEFCNRDDFYALRLEPYLNFMIASHPQIKSQLCVMVDELYRSNSVLVHGDISPKNIMFRDNLPILLDAECATMGDPGFDVAFCLNHIILKAIHLPEIRHFLFSAVTSFWRVYREYVSWESQNGLEARVAALVPMLMLARIDGKSPVEYLSATEQDMVRTVSIPLILKSAGTITDLLSRLEQSVEKRS